MCTPWTHPRLVRCRARDWALNFLACGIHLDHERCPQPTKVSALKRNRNERRPMQNGVRVKECEQAAAVTDSATRNISNVDSEDSCWPHFSDEDYIVFCFREDGAFDIVKDDQDDADEVVFPRSSEDNCSTRRVVNRKLSYGNEVEVERFYDHSLELIAREADCIVKKMTSGRKPIVAKKEVVAKEEGLNSDAKKGADQIEESEDSGMVSAESNGSSNQSDTSTSSFAFPVLSWEWSGSPVEMPKSGRGVQLKKHRARLHCCRF